MKTFSFTIILTFNALVLIIVQFFIPDIAFSQNQPPVINITINSPVITWTDSTLIDASGTYDPDGDPLQFNWTTSPFMFIHEIENGTKAYIIPFSGGHISITLSVTDGTNTSDTTLSILVNPSKEHISVDYSYVDRSWSRNFYYYKGDTLLVPLWNVDSLRIYRLTSSGVLPIQNVYMENTVKITGLKNNMLYTITEGTSGYFGPGPLSIYSVGSQWQFTPVLTNYLPGTSDIMIMQFISNDSALVLDFSTLYLLDFATPSIPQILNQRDLFPNRPFSLQTVDNYIYVGVLDLFWKCHIVVLNKFTFDSVTTLNIPDTLKSFSINNGILLVGFQDHLSIYDLSNPLQPSYLSTISIPPPNNHIAQLFFRYFGKFIGNNLIAVKMWGGLHIYDISIPSNPVQKAYWYSGLSGQGVGSNIYAGQGNYFITPDFGGTADTNNIFSGINKIQFDFINPIRQHQITTVQPKRFRLSPNYPNPFNPVTHIPFTLPRASQVKIEIYNLLGQRVAVLLDERKPAGSYTTEFDGSSLPSGVYLCRMQAREFRQVRKMLLIK